MKLIKKFSDGVGFPTLNKSIRYYRVRHRGVGFYFERNHIRSITIGIWFMYKFEVVNFCR